MDNVNCKTSPLVGIRGGQLIGVDLGGTNTVFGIVNNEGNIVCENSIKTQAYPDIHDFVEACVQCVNPLIDQIGGKQLVGGMGIGAPNANFYTGTIEEAPNLPWKGKVPLAQMLSERLGLKVVMTNDANAAAMGEMAYGAARGMRHFVVITLGTGVGSGIVIDGKLVYGSDGFAGELGHMIIDPSPTARQCGCGRRGCLETYCSARGIVRTAEELIASGRPTLLRNVSDLSALEIFKAAKQDDAVAIETFRRTGETLGDACANITTFCSPEAYIFFGGPMHSHEFIFPALIETYNRQVLPIYRNRCKFLLSELMDRNAAVLGAAALCHE